MTLKNPKSIADRLKEIVELNGPSYLEDEPYKVYTDLVESGTADRKTGAAILHFLTSGAMESVDSAYDAEMVSKTMGSSMFRLKVMEMTMGMSQSAGITGTNLYDGMV